MSCAWTDVGVLLEHKCPYQLTNWEGMVTPTDVMAAQERPCFFCGSSAAGARKSIPFDTLREMYANVEDSPCRWRQVLQNMLLTTEHLFDPEKQHMESVMSCVCCFHWMKRKKHNKGRYVLPFQSLCKTIRLVRLGDKQQKMDIRVVRRLCSVLCEPRNYFFSVLFPHEREVVCQVAQCESEDAFKALVTGFCVNNADSLFVMNRQVAEDVREHVSWPCEHTPDASSW